jgi:hypothetical protein
MAEDTAIETRPEAAGISLDTFGQRIIPRRANTYHQRADLLHGEWNDTIRPNTLNPETINSKPFWSDFTPIVTISENAQPEPPARGSTTTPV